MSPEQSALYMLKLMPYDKIVHVIIELLRKLSERSDNHLDDLIVGILENVLNKALNCGEK